MTHRWVVAVAALVATLRWLAPIGASAAAFDDFGLGQNAESQTCRGVWRFESSREPSAIDIYCGQWASPSGTLRVVKTGAEAADLLARSCGGPAAVVSDSGGITIRQVSCA